MEAPIKKLLIIDDDVIFREALHRIVSKVADVVLEAADGAVGLEMIRNEKPHAVVSDYNMPGLNGVELLQLLKKEKIMIPVIALTGDCRREIYREAWALGVYDFFTKPVDLEVLRDCVRGALSVGQDFNQSQARDFIDRIHNQEFSLTVEKELYEKFAAYCKTNQVSMTTMIRALIETEIENGAPSEVA